MHQNRFATAIDIQQTEEVDRSKKKYYMRQLEGSP